MTIENIIKTEWDMFQKVDNIGGRAGCQEEWDTFQIMRASQYESWPEELVKSYEADLAEAANKRRNLVMEKYAYMMEFTQNSYYKTLLEPYLPKVDEESMGMIQEITRQTLAWEREFEKKYPKLAKSGRKTNDALENSSDASVETYTIGELKTYSKPTLRIYLNNVEKMKAEGKNLVTAIKETMVKKYGYASIEDAENKA